MDRSQKLTSKSRWNSIDQKSKARSSANEQSKHPEFGQGISVETGTGQDLIKNVEVMDSQRLVSTILMKDQFIVPAQIHAQNFGIRDVLDLGEPRPFA